MILHFLRDDLSIHSGWGAAINPALPGETSDSSAWQQLQIAGTWWRGSTVSTSYTTVSTSGILPQRADTADSSSLPSRRRHGGTLCVAWRLMFVVTLTALTVKLLHRQQRLSASWRRQQRLSNIWHRQLRLSTNWHWQQIMWTSWHWHLVSLDFGNNCPIIIVLLCFLIIKNNRSYKIDEHNITYSAHMRVFTIYTLKMLILI